MDTQTTRLTIFAIGDRVRISHKDGSTYSGAVSGVDDVGIALKSGYACKTSGVGTFTYRNRKFLPWKAISGVDFEEER